MAYLLPNCSKHRSAQRLLDQEQMTHPYPNISSAFYWFGAFEKESHCVALLSWNLLYRY